MLVLGQQPCEGGLGRDCAGPRGDGLDLCDQTHGALEGPAGEAGVGGARVVGGQVAAGADRAGELVAPEGE